MTKVKQWTAEEDDALVRLILSGTRYQAVGDLLGRTKNSCVGRMHRLLRKMEEGDEQGTERNPGTLQGVFAP